jgi:hypothetical protein
MKSLIHNLDRKKVLLILEWCKKNFGRSRYHRKYPTLRVYKSKGNSAFAYRDGGLFGTYDHGVITIYLGSHDSMRELCKTVIHEYRHYLMSIREYNSLYKKMEREGSDPEIISYEHPHEKDCEDFEDEWGELCFSQLRKKLYKKD